MSKWNEEEGSCSQPYWLELAAVSNEQDFVDERAECIGTTGASW